MQINAKQFTFNYVNTQANNKRNLKNILKDIGFNNDNNHLEVNGKNITNLFLAKSFQISITQVSIQGNLSEFANLKNTNNITNFLNTMSKKGGDFANLKNLTPEKAKELITDDGFWGIKETAKRISDFVLIGAGDDVAKLKAGKEGIMQGLNEAKKMLGGFNKGYEQIANDTIDSALNSINKRISSLGEKVIDLKA